MSKVQNIGLLMTCNEDDILEEMMLHNKKYFDKILVIDGSTDRSEEIIRSFDNVVYFLKEQDIYPKPKPNDALRQHILQKAQEMYGTEGWFTLMHADELFVDDPNRIVERAEKKGAEVVNWHSLNFFLHASQKKEDFTVKRRVQESVRFYQPGSLEIRQFKNKKNIYYDPYQICNVRPHGLKNKTLLDFPIYKHYVFRSPEQMLKRSKEHERMAKFVGSSVYEACFRDKYIEGLKQVREYKGSFEEFEPGKRPSFFFQWLNWRKYK